MKQIIFGLALGVVFLSFSLAQASPLQPQQTANSAFILITPDEARMPEGKLLPPKRKLQGSAESQGPVVRFVNPENESVAERPLAIKILFEQNKAPIDLSSFKVSYLKFLSIDITDRIRPYVNPNGIETANAQVPEGRHRLRFSIADTEGRTTEETLTVEVK